MSCGKRGNTISREYRKFFILLLTACLRVCVYVQLFAPLELHAPRFHLLTRLTTSRFFSCRDATKRCNSLRGAKCISDKGISIGWKMRRCTYFLHFLKVQLDSRKFAQRLRKRISRETQPSSRAEPLAFPALEGSDFRDGNAFPEFSRDRLQAKIAGHCGRSS